MIERAVDRFEESAAIGAVLPGRQLRRGVVKPAIGPGIVATEHPVVVCGGHAFRPVYR
jgi:hypothetical protein